MSWWQAKLILKKCYFKNLHAIHLFGVGILWEPRSAGVVTGKRKGVREK